MCVVQVDPLPFDSEKLLELIAKRQQAAADAKRKAHLNPLSTSMTSSTAVAAAHLANRIALDKDLGEVLYGRVPRQYGEMPVNCGGFQRICPNTPAYERTMKVKSSHLRPKAARPPLG